MRRIFLLILIVAAPLVFAAEVPAVSVSDTEEETFARYLVPITTRNVPGGHGSLWTSELMVHNASDEKVAISFTCYPLLPLLPPGLVGPCPPLESGQAARYLLPVRGNGLDGGFIDIPRSVASDVHFQLRVRDLSRNASGFGAEVPVVPLEAFRPGALSGMPDPVHLIGIPVDSRYRATLRIYGARTEPVEVRIDVHAASDGRKLDSRLIRLSPGTASQPSYAQLDPFGLEVQASGESWVSLKIGSEFPALAGPPQWHPLWAMVSITNNVTQEVTMITPHRP